MSTTEMATLYTTHARVIETAGIEQSVLHNLFARLSELTAMHDQQKRVSQRSLILRHATGPYMAAIEVLRTQVPDLPAMSEYIAVRLDRGWVMDASDQVVRQFDLLVNQYEAVEQARSASALTWVMDRMDDARYA